MYFIHNEEKILQILRNRYDDIFHQINYIYILDKKNNPRYHHLSAVYYDF